MMITTRQIPAMRARRRTRGVIGAALGACLLASCNNFDVENLNAPTAETLTGSPSREVLARTAVGIQTQALNDRGGDHPAVGDLRPRGVEPARQRSSRDG